MGSRNRKLLLVGSLLFLVGSGSARAAVLPAAGADGAALVSETYICKADYAPQAARDGGYHEVCMNPAHTSALIGTSPWETAGATSSCSAPEERFSARAHDSYLSSVLPHLMPWSSRAAIRDGIDEQPRGFFAALLDAARQEAPSPMPDPRAMVVFGAGFVGLAYIRLKTRLASES